MAKKALVELLGDATKLLTSFKKTVHGAKTVQKELREISVQTKSTTEAVVASSVKRDARMREEIRSYRQLSAAAAKGSKEQVAAANLAAAAQKKLARSTTISAAEQRKLATAARHSASEVGRGARGALAGSGLFRSLGRSLAFASAGFLSFAILTHQMRESINEANAMQVAVARTSVVFRDSAKQVKEWAGKLKPSFGLTKVEALGFAGVLGAMLNPMGIVRKQAALMSTTMVTLAGDLGAFFHTDPTVVLKSMRSGLAGLPRPMRQFGVFLSKDRIEAEALTSGLVKANVNMKDVANAQKGIAVAQARVVEARKKYAANSIEVATAERGLHTAEKSLTNILAGHVPKLTQAQKTMAAYALILKDTADIQGFAAKTGKTWAGQMRELHAIGGNLEEEIGHVLMPTFLRYIRHLTTWLRMTGNQEKIVNAVKTGITGLAGALSVAGAVVVPLARGLNYVARAIGGWKTLIEVAIGAWVGFKAAGIGAAIAVQAANISAASATATAWRVALLTTGWGALAVVAGIAAAYIISHWSKVKVWFQKFWVELIIAANRTALDVVEPFSHLPGFMGGWARQAKERILSNLDGLRSDMANLGRSVGEIFGEQFATAALRAVPVFKDKMGRSLLPPDTRGGIKPSRLSDYPAGRQMLISRLNDQISKVQEDEAKASAAGNMKALRAALRSERRLLRAELKLTKNVKDRTSLFNQIADINTQISGTMTGTTTTKPPKPDKVVPGATTAKDWTELPAALAYKLAIVEGTKSLTDDIKVITEILALMNKRLNLAKTMKDKAAILDAINGYNEQNKALHDELKKAQQAARDARQFKALGLSATGDVLAPTRKALRSELSKVATAMKGTFLDTSEHRSLLQGIRRVLSGQLGALSAEVRSKIQSLIDGLKGQLDDFDGFNLTRAERRRRFLDKQLRSPNEAVQRASDTFRTSVRYADAPQHHAGDERKKKRALGGPIRGRKGVDQIPAWVTDGEIVLAEKQQRNARQMLGLGHGSPEGLFAHLDQGARRYAHGGPVTTGGTAWRGYVPPGGVPLGLVDVPHTSSGIDHVAPHVYRWDSNGKPMIPMRRDVKEWMEARTGEGASMAVALSNAEWWKKRWPAQRKFDLGGVVGAVLGAPGRAVKWMGKTEHHWNLHVAAQEALAKMLPRRERGARIGALAEFAAKREFRTAHDGGVEWRYMDARRHGLFARLRDDRNRQLGMEAMGNSVHAAAGRSLFVLPGAWPGMLQRGNINLLSRPSVPNPRGGMSSVFSTSFADEHGREVLVPQVLTHPGRIVSPRAAWAHYLHTGRQLGIFGATKGSSAVDNADRYASALHREQAGLRRGGVARVRALAGGGIVKKDSLVRLGERGAEAVVPLSPLMKLRINAALDPTGRSGGRGGKAQENHYHYEPRQSFRNRKDADDANRRGFFQMRQVFA